MEFLDASGINALIITILILLLALRAGRMLFSRLAPPDSFDPLESVFFSLSLGLGLLSLATFGLAALGLLSRPLFRILFFLALALCVPGLLREFRSLRRIPRGRASSWLSYLVIAFLAGIVGVCLVAALAPETGFDALNYHLGIPRLYIANHRIVETENLAGYSHPLAVNMLYLFAWLVHSVLAAKLIHLAFGLLIAFGCWVFCRRYAPGGCGGLAALLFLASPIVMFLSQTAYVDLGLACFALLALFALFRWLETGLRQWILLAGIYSGFSLGAKYMGATVIVVAIAIALTRLPRSKQRPRILLDIGLYCVVSLLVFAPWLIKNWIMSGNPVSPMLANVIPTRGFASPDYDRLVQLTRSWHGYSGGLLDWILTPWRQTFRPDIFHGSPGVAYLVLFPVAVALSWRDRWLRYLAFSVAVGYVFLLLGTATTRFFVLIFPWISILIAGAVWPRKPGKPELLRLGLVLLSLVLIGVKLPWFAGLGGIPEPLVLDTDKLTVFGSSHEREQFLEAKALGPGGNQLYRYLQTLPKGTRILALTPVYQALTDHEVFMPPNSTPSSQMADAAIELAKNATGLSTLELNFARVDLSCRFWKVQVLRAAPLKLGQIHPRLFYIENGIPMEISAWSVTLEPSTGAVHEILVDLGAPSKVERITLLNGFLNGGPYTAAGYRVFGSPGWSKDKWQQVPIRLPLRDASKQSLLDGLLLIPDPQPLRALLIENRITHLVLGHHPGAEFLTEFFVKREGMFQLRPIASFGDYDVLRWGPNLPHPTPGSSRTRP